MFIRTVLGTLVITSVVLSARAITASQSESPLASAPELLTEIRLLRQAVENLAGNGARAQILLGRLQLQEHRTDAVVRRADDLRSKGHSLSREVAEMSVRLKDITALMNDGGRSPEEQENFRQEVSHLKRKIDAVDRERRDHNLRESDAVNAVGEEQARWSDLNRQLEELERALAPRRP